MITVITAMNPAREGAKKNKRNGEHKVERTFSRCRCLIKKIIARAMGR